MATYHAYWMTYLLICVPCDGKPWFVLQFQMRNWRVNFLKVLVLCAFNWCIICPVLDNSCNSTAAAVAYMFAQVVPGYLHISIWIWGDSSVTRNNLHHLVQLLPAELVTIKNAWHISRTAISITHLGLMPSCQQLHMRCQIDHHIKCYFSSF